MRLARSAACGLLALLLAVAAAGRGSGPAPSTYHSAHLDADIVALPGVFAPAEAELVILPFMAKHPELFAGKVVMEIGTGTGIVSLYAARLGARRVVATDIEPNAVESARRNARALGYESAIDVRLVPATDMSAYSTLRADEAFDTIVSNPPYVLDLDARRNSALMDKGDLGFSIVRGLDAHLRPGGRAALYYGSLFYHDVMVKFARHEGWQVADHTPRSLVPWEARVLFNAYLARLLEQEGMDPQALRFRQAELKGIRVEGKYPPLFDGDTSGPWPGWLVIRRRPKPPALKPPA